MTFKHLKLHKYVLPNKTIYLWTYIDEEGSHVSMTMKQFEKYLNEVKKDLKEKLKIIEDLKLPDDEELK